MALFSPRRGEGRWRGKSGQPQKELTSQPRKVLSLFLCPNEHPLPKRTALIGFVEVFSSRDSNVETRSKSNHFEFSVLHDDFMWLESASKLHSTCQALKIRNLIRNHQSR